MSRTNNAQIEPFQEDPQLLDARLKTLLPPLIDAYLAYLQNGREPEKRPVRATLDVAVSKILYTFCKVRGEKVVVGFFNNEPKYLDLVLSALERRSIADHAAEAFWETSYVLLLWMSHLLLAPFDLVSILDGKAVIEPSSAINIPQDIPGSAQRVITVASKYVYAATKEQDAATKMLVRLVTRPDMQRLRLQDHVVSWALQSLSPSESRNSSDIHHCLGPLRFLNDIIASADPVIISHLIPRIYRTAQAVMEDAMYAFLNSSAVTKKLIIKLFRNIAIMSLQPATGPLLSFFETTSVLEDVIDHLLQSLADRDTPVRFTASKAISMIILKLDPEMGYEVVQAVMDSFQEDVPQFNAEMDLRSVNPLRWHGLTLTLAHTLFRRSASPQQLPEIVNALILALTFEQRSTTGSSIGANVRDAANFGIWSLARRYTTAELLSVDVTEIQKRYVQKGTESVIQAVAVQLILAACFDPAGNIRRGSSAALQELIGRHPDQVYEGIPLVQIVDFHAVGLRQRAMIDVAHRASALNETYWNALLIGLLDWRGIGSPDVLSREAAGTSIGRLCAARSHEDINGTLTSLQMQVDTHTHADVEQCHGALNALSCIINDKLNRRQDNAEAVSYEELASLARLWQVFGTKLPLYASFTPRSLKAEVFPAVARLITSLAHVSHILISITLPNALPKPTARQLEVVSEVVAGLLNRSEETILRTIPDMIRTLLAHKWYQFTHDYDALVIEISLSKVLIDSASTTLHGAGRLIAIGASNPADEAIDVLVDLKASPIIEWRVIRLRGLQLAMEAWWEPFWGTADDIVRALNTGLNDYTITERGDVGSLVRVRAVECVQYAFTDPDPACAHYALLHGEDAAQKVLYADVLRLSFEKLDRVRLQAARCLQSIPSPDIISFRDPPLRGESPLTDVSSYDYFLRQFLPLTMKCPEWMRKAIISGCTSCAGVGNEAILQASRKALVDTIQASDSQDRLSSTTTISDVLKDMIVAETDSQPLLELLAFLLDALPMQDILPNDFKLAISQSTAIAGSPPPTDAYLQVAQRTLPHPKIPLQVQQHPQNPSRHPRLQRLSSRARDPPRSAEETRQHA